MDNTPEDEGQPSRPPPRFALFRNRPTWANTSQSPTVEEDDDPFDRTNQTLAQLQAEDTRKKEKRAKKKHTEKVKMEKPPSREFMSKRIKFSDVQDLLEDDVVELDSEDDTTPMVDTRKEKVYHSENGPSSYNHGRGSTSPSSPRARETTPSQGFKELQGTIINIDSESEDNIGSPDLARYGAGGHALEDTLTQDIPGYLDGGEDNSPNVMTSFNDTPLPPPAPEIELPDPVITILITSTIPNTTPLMVQRKLSQRLKEVRLAWCQKQGFDETTTTSVFLTWRRRRLFDYTSCKGLGLSVDASGEVYIQGHSDQAPGDENAQLHMEAMTTEILEAEKKAALQPPKEEEVAEGSASPRAKSGPPGIKVILRSKGYEDYKLVVRPHTPFKQIVAVFRRMRDVAPKKSVSLEFDGETLAEEDTVGDSEIDDMDLIDVIVK